jgi:hypothetical protein
MKMGQTNMHNYMKPLLDRIEKRQIDPRLHHFSPHHSRRGSRDVQNLAEQGTERYQNCY